MQDQVGIRKVQVLSDDWGMLKKTTFALRRGGGGWGEQTRETYDRGNGASEFRLHCLWVPIII